MNKQKEKGQAMVEAMVALFVIVIALLGVFTLTTQSLGLNRVAADRYVAVNLANEGIELVKNLLDKNVMDYLIPGNIWNKYVNSEGFFEIDYNDFGLTSISNEGLARPLYFSKDGTGFYRYDQQDPQKDILTDFKRIIEIKIVSPNHLRVISKVFWITRGSPYDFSVQDDFYNLQEFKYNINIKNV